MCDVENGHIQALEGSEAAVNIGGTQGQMTGTCVVTVGLGQWKSQFRWHGSSELQRFVMLQMDGGAKLELFQYQGAEINRGLSNGSQGHADGQQCPVQ